MRWLALAGPMQAWCRLALKSPWSKNQKIPRVDLRWAHAGLVLVGPQVAMVQEPKYTNGLPSLGLCIFGAGWPSSLHGPRANNWPLPTGRQYHQYSVGLAWANVGLTQVGLRSYCTAPACKTAWIRRRPTAQCPCSPTQLDRAGPAQYPYGLVDWVVVARQARSNPGAHPVKSCDRPCLYW